MREDVRRAVEAVVVSLARIAASGAWSEAEIEQRWIQSLRRRKRLPWGKPLSQRLVESYPSVPGLADIVSAMGESLDLLRWIRRRLTQGDITLAPVGTPVMLPWRAGFRAWELPQITSPGQLADWLSISIGELDWFADRWSWERRRSVPVLQHYRYRWLLRSRHRLRPLESPKPRLKEMQRQILHELLDRIPVHPAAHGFRRGHSITSFVERHTGTDVVWKLDLREFFCRIRRPKIAAIFRTLGYPEPVVQYLAGLVTNAAPRSMLEDLPGSVSEQDRRLWARLMTTPHLPQGAPTSPALANLAAFQLDSRLNGLARAAGVNYSRYADDLVFSGNRGFGRSLARFRLLVLSIIIDEGFEIRQRKSRVMWRSQRQEIAGLVVNDHARLPRSEYDILKAILHNCRRFGPASQNRQGHEDFRAHLRGRIAYAAQFDSARGTRLLRSFDAIEWPPD